jgi:DNA-directed RNA polymerase subunit RPC12/RpoP
MTTTDLFPGPKPPRAQPRVLMHVSDAADCHTGKADDLGKPMCRMTCARCGAETDWLIFDTITEAKRGIPCEACNKTAGQEGGAS